MAILVAATTSVAAAEAPRCLGKSATITGGSGKVIRGTPGDDVITAYGDEYEVHARGGNDLVCGDSKGDIAYGGPGDDHVFSRASRGLHGGPGDDRVTGPVLWGGPGDDTLTATRPAVVLFNMAGRGVEVDLRKGSATGQGRDTLVGDFYLVVGSDHDDVLTGNSKSNMFLGGTGDDRIAGGAGADGWMLGGAGNDTIEGGTGPDAIDGEGGDDRLVGGRGKDGVYPGHGDDFVSTGPHSDTIFPTFGNDEVHGGGGRDWVYYWTWPEPVEIDLAGDWAEGAGSDSIEGIEDAHGGRGDDVVRGDEGPNELLGGEGDDRIDGFGGDDSIDAWDGIDAVDGGGGYDSCYYAEAPVNCEDVQPGAERRATAYFRRSMS